MSFEICDIVEDGKLIKNQFERRKINLLLGVIALGWTKNRKTKIGEFPGWEDGSFGLKKLKN